MRLIIERGPDVGRNFAVSQSRIVIGRGADCDVQLNDHRVSRHHTELRFEQGRWVVRDMGSSNGTWVNRRRLTQPYALNPGDELGVGSTVISFQLVDTTAPMPENYSPPWRTMQEQSAAYAAASGAGQRPAGLPAGDFGGTLALVLDGVVTFGALLLVISALLNWFSFTFLFVTQYIQGIEAVIGLAALIGGVLGFLMAAVALLLRLLLQRGESSLRRFALYLRWAYFGHIGIGVMLVGLAAVEVVRYNEGVQSEVLLGFTVDDLVTLSPEPGVYIAGAGLLLLLIGAAVQVAVALSAPRR
jgi:hypothetical protein